MQDNICNMGCVQGKKTHCEQTPEWVKDSVETPSGRVKVVSTTWVFSDHIGRIKSRISSFRMKYSIEPGLYAIGRPDSSSPVLVSANYKLSFDILRGNLKGLDAFILVLDTKGINVWCAAGKGTFGTDELINRVRKIRLNEIVRHRRLVVPQLGAPGIKAHIVQKETGFRVYYGPVYAKDIPAFLGNKYRADSWMRTVHFNLIDRAVLTPIEIIGMWRIFLLYTVIILIIFGLQPEGIIFRDALRGGYPFILFGVLSGVSGAFFTPLLLPVIPFRAFSVKGFFTGLILVAVGYFGSELLKQSGVFITSITFLFFPAVSSYLALNFTGATPFTNISGVKKEIKFALPFYIVITGMSFVLLILYKLKQWEVF